VQFRMKSALIGAAVGVALGFWVRIGNITWMVPPASTPAEAATYWISYSFFWAVTGFILGGFTSKLPLKRNRSD
jgi:hypothetical protein